MDTPAQIAPDTVRALIDALGGAPFVRYRLNVSKSNTSMWSRDGKIPARHYANLRRLAAEKRERDGVEVVVSDELFTFDPLPEVPQEAAE